MDAELLSGLSEIDCPRCEQRLDLSQPDDEQPRKLLGVCSCGWSVVQLGEDGHVQEIRLLGDQPRSS
jgi:hypothetical protein